MTRWFLPHHKPVDAYELTVNASSLATAYTISSVILRLWFNRWSETEYSWFIINMLRANICRVVMPEPEELLKIFGIESQGITHPPRTNAISGGPRSLFNSFSICTANKLGHLVGNLYISYVSNILNETSYFDRHYSLLSYNYLFCFVFYQRGTYPNWQ